MRKIFFLFILLLVVSVIAGCSSSDTGNTGTSVQDSGKTQDTGDSGSDDVNSMFTSIMGKNPRYKATYDIISDIDGASSTQAMTMYFDRKDRFRTDITATAQGQTSTIMIFMLDGKGYMCTSQGGNVFCLEQADYQQPKGQDIVNQMKEDPAKYLPKYDGTISLAGRTGTCFKVDVEDGSSRVCFSKDGILLLSEITISDGKITMKVKSIGSTSPDDFKLPAEPQKMPDIPGGIPGGFGPPQ